MRCLSGSVRLLLPVIMLSSALAFACETIPADVPLWIRLVTPVSTYTAKPGDKISAVLTEAVECDGEVVFPIGTDLTGVVRSVRKVGWGFHHETAALQIEFTQIASARPIAISTEVLEVENAREQTTKGTIHGILSSDTPEGRINSRLKRLPTYNPYSDLGLIIYKASFPIFPEPEIYLPAGTDIELKLTKAIEELPNTLLPTIVPVADSYEDQRWASMAASWPDRTTTTTQVPADFVNLAFVGSRQQIQAAFLQAGWVESVAFDKHSFMRDFYAFVNNSGYAQAPMRTFLLDGRPEDMNWEKSLNSYARRDHLRIWQWTDASGSEMLWLSSSTHDTGAALSLKRHEFVHHISPDIDQERSKVIRDLTAAGCVQAVHTVPRHDAVTLAQNATGDMIRTDGDIAIVQLKTCHPVSTELAAAPQSAQFKPGNHAFRYIRRQILTFRSDIFRANIIYSAYDLGRMTVAAWRHHSAASSAYAALEHSQPHPIPANQRAGDSTARAEPIESGASQ